MICKGLKLESQVTINKMPSVPLELINQNGRIVPKFCRHMEFYLFTSINKDFYKLFIRAILNDEQTAMAVIYLEESVDLKEYAKDFVKSYVYNEEPIFEIEI